MKNRSRYVFGAALAGLTLSAVPGLVEKAHAASITAADFTFETTGLTFSTSVTSPVLGPLVAESGTGAAVASHAAAGTVYSSPAGNGSTHSLSSNDWAAGDYYQFSVPTTGLDDLLLSFDQTSSSTGPHVFELQYSTDGLAYVNYSGYTVFSGAVTATNSTGGTTSSTGFSPTFTQTAYNESFNLTGLTALNNDALAAFRLVEADTTTATAGTSRVDNVIVAGDSAAATPEPAVLGLTAMGVLGLLGRRRRTQI